MLPSEDVVPASEIKLIKLLKDAITVFGSKSIIWDPPHPFPLRRKDCIFCM